MTKHPKTPTTEPLNAAEICVIELHVNGALERQQPEIAAMARGLIHTIRALQADNERLREALEEVKDYFDQRADIHHDNPYAPNEEMRFWVLIKFALEKS